MMIDICAIMPSKPHNNQKQPEFSIFVVKRLDFAMTELVELNNQMVKDDRLTDAEHEQFKDVIDAIKEMYVAMELYAEYAIPAKKYFLIDPAKIAKRKSDMDEKSP